jgi:hypothetical protein
MALDIWEWGIKSLQNERPQGLFQACHFGHITGLFTLVTVPIMGGVKFLMNECGR